MFATLTISGSSLTVTQTACGRRARAMRRTTIACSSRSLSERISCSPRWSSTAGSAERRVEPGERDGRGAQPLAAHEQLRRGGDERGVAAADAEDVAGGEPRAQHAERRRGVVRGRRVDGDLAREHDLLEGPGADALDGPRDRRLVVLGRRDRGDPVAARRAPGRAAAAARGAARRRAPTSRSTTCSGTSSGATSAASVRRTSRPRRASESSGTIRSPAAKPAQCGASPPSGAKAKPPTATSPAPAGPSGASASARARQLAPLGGRAGEAPGAGGADLAHAAERGERGAVAVGLLEAEPRLPRRGGRRTRSRSGRSPASTATVSAGEHLAALAAGTPDRALAAREQLGAGRAGQARCRTDGHQRRVGDALRQRFVIHLAKRLASAHRDL